MCIDNSLALDNSEASDEPVKSSISVDPVKTCALPGCSNSVLPGYDYCKRKHAKLAKKQQQQQHSIVPVAATAEEISRLQKQSTEQIFSWIELKLQKEKEIQMSNIFGKLNTIFRDLLQGKFIDNDKAARRDIRVKIIEEIMRRKLTNCITDNVAGYRYNSNYIYLFCSNIYS